MTSVWGGREGFLEVVVSEETGGFSAATHLPPGCPGSLCSLTEGGSSVCHQTAGGIEGQFRGFVHYLVEDEELPDFQRGRQSALF